MKNKLIGSILFTVAIIVAVRISHMYDFSRNVGVVVAFLLTIIICFLSMRYEVKNEEDKLPALIGSIAISSLIIGAFYFLYITPEEYHVLGILSLFAVVYFFVNRFGKGEKSSSKPDSTLKEIESHKVVEINDGMTDSEKWSITIKNFAHRLYDTQLFNDEAKALWKISNEAERPLLVLVMGEFKTGKSTFINTLLKEDILTTDVAPATAVVTLLTFGKEKTATIHYLDGTEEKYDIEKLSEITAEGDASKEELRDRIEFVELTYPNEMLKKIEIVDTPGLNVHKQSHINSTENFQSRADMVLWVFNAARMATRSEVEKIEMLGQRLKPLAIVNRIDNIDEDEETIEEVLQRVKKKLKNHVSDVIGISAGQAHEALLSGNESKLSESRWQSFLDLMKTQITEQAEPLKIKSIHDKLAEFCVVLNNSIMSKERSLNEKRKYFSDAEGAKKSLIIAAENLTDATKGCVTVQNKIRNVKNIFDRSFKYISIDEWQNNPVDFMYDALATISILDPFKEFLSLKQSEETQKFIREIEMYSAQSTRTQIHVEDWINKLEQLAKEGEALRKKENEVSQAEYQYKHSGIFGGEPITDFSGKRARLNRLVNEYNDFANRLETKRKDLLRESRTLMENICNICAEVGDLTDKIKNFLNEELKQCQQQMKSLEQNFEKDKTQYQQELQQVELGRELLINIRESLS